MKTLFLILLLTALLQASYTKTDGIVSDSETGLMWQDDYDNNPATTGDTVASLNWTQAISYCNNLTDLGHDDWRLPNVNELVSITDDTTSSPAINGAFEHTRNSYYWSATTYAADTAAVWLVNFYSGNVVASYKSHTDYVRCVRGSVAPLNTSFIPTLMYLLD